MSESATAKRSVWPLLVFIALSHAAVGLRASFIAEDSTILRYVHEHGALGDWFGSQYGLQLVLFWRPVVTTSWWLQELAFGTWAPGLRALNVLTHVGCALFAAGIVRRLGGQRSAMIVAWALVLFFPHMGGTVTWIAGRVDTLSGFFVMMAAWMALGRRPAWAALPAFLACASKEVAFAVPAWVIALRWAAGDDARSLVRNACPTVLVVAVAFVWRRLALGIWTGGYPVSPTELAGSMPQVALALFSGSFAILLGVVISLVLGKRSGGLHLRLGVAGLVCAAVSFLPILPMLTTGVLEPQNERWLFVGEMGLALTCAAGLSHASERLPAKVLLTVLALLVVQRFWVAFGDIKEWQWAAQEADQAVSDARAILAEAAPGDHPVLFDFFPTSFEGAYCLGFGVPDRFREPFEAAPRPVWPLRPMFGRESSRRLPVVSLRADGSLWNWTDRRGANTPLIEVTLEGGELFVDERCFLAEPDESPRIDVMGAFPGAGFELVVYTELGYEPAPWTADDANLRTLTLMQALACSNGAVTIGETLAQAADVGATRAYLELRAVNAQGDLVAASRWLELNWSPDLIDRLR